MSYTYSETLRSRLLHTEVIISAKNTATTVQIPKAYALAAIGNVNNENVNLFESKQFVTLTPDGETGFVIDGTCDVNLILAYTGTNTSIAKTFNIEIKDTDVSDPTDFKLFVEATLANYYPAVSISATKIKTAVITFHD